MKKKKTIIFIFIIILMILGSVFFTKWQFKWDDVWLEKVFAGKVEYYDLSLKEKINLNQLIWNLELEQNYEIEDGERVCGGESVVVVFEEGATMYVWSFTQDNVTCAKYESEVYEQRSVLWVKSYLGDKELYNTIKAYTEK